MNKKDYVSLDVALMMKTLGFNEHCDKNHIEKVAGTEREEWDKEECRWCTVTKITKIPIPSLYQAQKWIRGCKGFHCCTSVDRALRWSTKIVRLSDNETLLLDDNTYNTYEQAMNASILAVLKYINITKPTCYKL